MNIQKLFRTLEPLREAPRIAAIGDTQGQFLEQLELSGHTFTRFSRLRELPNGAMFDICFVLGSNSEFFSTLTDDDFEQLATFLAEKCQVSFVESQVSPIVPSLNDIGPLSIPSQLLSLEFISEHNLEELENPLIAVSDKWVFVSGEWINRANVVPLYDRRGFVKHNSHWRPRTYKVNRGQVIKFQTSGSDFFEQCELKREIEFLESSGLEGSLSGRIPEIIKSDIGQVVVSLVTKEIEGENLVKACAVASHEEKALIARGVMELVQKIRSRGFFHNDLRPWNFLVDSKHRVSVVDFGFASTNNLDARGIGQNLALLGVLATILSVRHAGNLLRMGEKFSSDLENWRLAVSRDPGISDLLAGGNTSNYQARLPDFEDLCEKTFVELIEGMKRVLN